MKESGKATPARPESALKHPFLKGLAEEHLAKVMACSMPVQFEAGQFVFRQGEPANRFYLIQKGTVALEAKSDAGSAVTIQTISPGEVLGWSWLFPPYTWQFDAHALEPVDAVFFYGTRLREECENDPALGYELMKRVSEIMMTRLQATRRKLSAQSTASST